MNLKYNLNVIAARRYSRFSTRLLTGAAVVLSLSSTLLTAEPPDPPSTRPAPSFREARALLLSGRYERATAAYDELAASPQDRVRAACARAEVDLLVGTYTKGIARLTGLADQGRRSADWHAVLAALLERVGRYDEALIHNRRSAKLHPGHLRAHWQLGRLYERLGRPREALDAYRLFEDVMTMGELPETAEDLTYLGRGFYRASVLKRHPNLVQRTKHVLTEVYQEAFDFLDAAYWPARLAAAELLLEKHSHKEARSDFQHVCEQNDRVPAAHVGLGRIALEAWDFEEAEGRAKAALDVNPHHLEAHVLLADVRMTERRYGEAARATREALKMDPNAIEALSVLAAAQLRAGKTAESHKTQQRIMKINPRPAQMHHALGVWLAAGRQYEPAREHLERAIAFAPTWPEPRTELGLLYMETGDEAAAREVLEAAFSLDSFNTRTHNVLELLETLDKFARIETEHFIVKFDGKEDWVIGPYFAEALETIYDEVCEDFDERPADRTIVEVFPSHPDFSVRVHGRPFIATVGACTGRVIALAAPRRSTPFGRYNWAAVLRHEFTHAVTLAATENRIPHWMTEGMAVYEEPAPRTWETKRMLTDTVRRDGLFTLEAIDWGFIRPRHPNDRALAYAQSEWMIEYIVERWRYRAVSAFLKAFKEGMTQAEAFRHVLKTDVETFDTDFGHWAAAQVQAWGLPERTLETPAEIKSRLQERPDDPSLLAMLAEAELLRGELDNAREAVQRALEQDADHVKALEVLCHVLMVDLLRQTDEDLREESMNETKPHLRRLIGLDPENPTAIKYLGYMEQARKKWEAAIGYLTRYQRRFPEDPDTYRRLAAIHLVRADFDQALRQLEQLFRLVEQEPAVARQIASIYTARGQAARAVRWYRRAIEIDPYDVDTHLVLGNSCLKTGDLAAAEQAFQTVCRFQPEAGAGFAGLSRVYASMGNAEKAEANQKKAEARGYRPEGEGSMTHRRG